MLEHKARLRPLMVLLLMLLVTACGTQQTDWPPVSATCPVIPELAATRAAGVLSDMLGRADQRAGELAKIADQSRIAGEACQREYDYLKQGKG